MGWESGPARPPWRTAMSIERTASRDLPGRLIAAAFILLGAVFWCDTTDMADPDSYVFPRAIIALMIAFSLLQILRNLVYGGQPHSYDEGSWPRRIGLVAVMLLVAL